MKKTFEKRPEIKLAGLKVRTNNAAEMNVLTAQISPLVLRYFSQGTPELLPHRQNPGVTLCTYTDYENGIYGNYTYFVGEAVTSFEALPEGLETLIIPPQNYAKFTTEPGIFPLILIEAWQKIWQLSDQELGGKRLYQADFELYDQRAQNPQNAALDIYIGLEETV